MASEVKTMKAIPPYDSGKKWPDEWFNGKVWKLKVPGDIDVDDVQLARERMHNTARARGWRIRTHKLDDSTLLIQRVDTATHKPTRKKAAKK